MEQTATSVQAGRMIRDLLVINHNYRNEQMQAELEQQPRLSRDKRLLQAPGEPTPEQIAELQAALSTYFSAKAKIPADKVPEGIHVIEGRIGNQARDACTDRLGEAVATGIISEDEFAVRSQKALSAVTRAELDYIVSDLPALPSRPRRFRPDPFILGLAVMTIIGTLLTVHGLLVLIPVAYVISIIVVTFTFRKKVP